MQLLTALQRQLPLQLRTDAPKQQPDRDSPKALLTDAIIMLNRTIEKDAELVRALKATSSNDNMKNIDFDPSGALAIITEIKTLLPATSRHRYSKKNHTNIFENENL